MKETNEFAISFIRIFEDYHIIKHSFYPQSVYFLREHGKAPNGKVYSKYYNRLRPLKLYGLSSQAQKRKYSSEPSNSTSSVLEDIDQPSVKIGNLIICHKSDLLEICLFSKLFKFQS